jgi:DNA gyrase subunit B
MPSLIERGFLYIAQPPLYKVKRGQSDTYLKNEDALYKYLKEIIVKNSFAKVEKEELRDFKLSMFLNKLIQFSNITKNYANQLPVYIIEIFLFTGFFKDSDKDIDIKKIIAPLNKYFSEKVIEWRHKTHKDALELTKLERGVQESYTISRNLFSEKSRETINALADELKDFITKGEFYYKEEKVECDTVAKLLEKLFANAKKGLYIQRFKGLGEMNPEQLWETTLDPENRMLLQVKVNDASEAEEVFSTLMGDVVEPRRDFIKSNALKVANLDC